MIECCTNCKYYRDMSRYYCKDDGGEITVDDGYACIERSNDGKITHVVGADPDRVHCVEWSRKSI